MLGMILTMGFFGCGGDENNDLNNGDTVLNWPQEFAPNPYTGNSTTGRFRENINEQVPAIRFDRKTVEGDKMYFYTSTNAGGVEIDLIEKNGKEMKVKIINGRGIFTDGTEYILCTSYVLENGVLTFTGGNITGVSNITWNIYNQ